MYGAHTLTDDINQASLPAHLRIYALQPHRVLIPREDCVHSQSRQSVAFFAQADNAVTIRCIDGSDKYPPIRAEDDLKERFLKSYGYGEYQ